MLHCPPLLVSEPAGKPVPAPSAGEKPAAQREASAGAVCGLGRIGFGFRQRSTKATLAFAGGVSWAAYLTSRVLMALTFDRLGLVGVRGY